MIKVKAVDIRHEKGFGYKTASGQVCMIQCFECGKENWAPAVSSGSCAWCGYNPNFEPMHKEPAE